MITRRSFLKSGGALVATSRLTLRQVRHIVVVGAGVFGGWTALSLLRKGARGDSRFIEKNMPCFLDGAVDPSYYGIPGNEWRGFKVAGGTRFPPLFDPTNGDRRVSPDNVDAARRYMSFRFPALKDAPLVESKVCQYESTPDRDFIVDQHPKAANVWIVGGGSGHGFKHGPAFGERVAETVLGERKKDETFSLSRFARL